jgi:two-component system KDP operon response regulator KdpE
MAEARILVVDDEPRYRYLLRVNLEARGYEVWTATRGAEALELLETREPDLVILDLRLPDIDGFEVCRAIRAASTVPVLMLTALTDHADRVRGLDVGADDYVPKPFNVEELLARVRALLRRAAYGAGDGPGQRLSFGPLCIDAAARQVTLAGQAVDLTPTEYRLLLAMARQAGRVLLHDDLLEAVWEETDSAQVGLVRQAVFRLRQKIEPDPGAPRYIHTHPGVGYVFEDRGA